jgi:hypothetical protein
MVPKKVRIENESLQKKSVASAGQEKNVPAGNTQGLRPEYGIGAPEILRQIAS